MNLRTTFASHLPPKQHNKSKIHKLSLYCGNVNWYNYFNTFGSNYSSWIYSICIFCDLVLPLLDIYPTEMLTDVHQKSHENLYRSTIHNRINWSYISVFNSRMDKLWNIHTMQYSIAMRTNNLQLYGSTWQTMGSKGSQTEHRLYYSFKSRAKTGITKIWC